MAERVSSSAERGQVYLFKVAQETAEKIAEVVHTLRMKREYPSKISIDSLEGAMVNFKFLVGPIADALKGLQSCLPQKMKESRSITFGKKGLTLRPHLEYKLKDPRTVMVLDSFLAIVPTLPQGAKAIREPQDLLSFSEQGGKDAIHYLGRLSREKLAGKVLEKFVHPFVKKTQLVQNPNFPVA